MKKNMIAYFKPLQSLFFRDNCQDIGKRSLLTRFLFTNQSDPFSDLLRGKDYTKAKQKGVKSYKVINSNRYPGRSYIKRLTIFEIFDRFITTSIPEQGMLSELQGTNPTFGEILHHMPRSQTLSP